MNTGVIVSVNVRYRNVQMERAVDFIEENGKDIYKIYILSAMRVLKRVWK